MGYFNMFGDNEHRVFNYKPIYYNPEEEERKRKFGAVDGSVDKEKKDGTYVPGSYIKGSFRDGNYQRTRTPMRRAQTIIGIITLILIFVVLYFIAKFYSML
ncbi:MAG: hypothetical protein Q4D10_00380 [Bacteroidales bacterium]|nr:hypothetical protein [Bacteroidales bacterium]MDO4212583.1 hypothetical protein [Bacteroidales bacterium]